MVQAAVAAHEKCNDKSCPFCSLDPGSVQQAVIAFKQALEASMKGHGPLPLIEVAQDASNITAAAAALANSNNLLTNSQQQQQQQLIQQQQHLQQQLAPSPAAAATAGLLSNPNTCSSAISNKLPPPQQQQRNSTAAAAANSQQLFAKGGWMEIFKGKLGKAAARLAGPMAAASSSTGSTQSVAGPGDTQGLTSRDLLEVLGVRSAHGGSALVGGGDASGDNDTYEDAQSDLDLTDSGLGQLVSWLNRGLWSLDQHMRQPGQFRSVPSDIQIGGEQQAVDTWAMQLFKVMCNRLRTDLICTSS